MSRQMLKTILVYGALLAAGSFGLEWLQYRFLVHAYPLETYLGLIALIFLVLGIWIGDALLYLLARGMAFRRGHTAPG